MKVTQEDTVQSQTVLQVELEPDDVERYLSWAYKRVVQKVNIPGFRKGKAPRAIVERFVGREALLNDALDYMVSDTTLRAVDQQELKAAASPEVEIEKLDPTIELKMTVPLVPDVDLGNYRELRVPFQEPEITDEQVQGSLEQLRKEIAPWEPVDRQVQLGDMLTLDVNGHIDGKQILDEKDVVYIVEEDNQRPFPGFSQKLAGLSKGLEQDFTLTIPEDYPNPDVASKECQFVVTAKEIKEQKLPDLDDEFAKSVGEGYDDFNTLQEKMRENLKEHANLHAKQEYREAAVDVLVNQAQLELPPLLVEREMDKIVQENQEALERQQIDMEQYLASVGKTEEQLREESREDAVKRLQRSWVLTKLLELENIKVEEEEVESRVESMTAGSSQNSQQLRRLFGSERGKESIRGSLLTEKVIDKLAVITKGGAAEGEESGEDRHSEEGVEAQKGESS